MLLLSCVVIGASPALAAPPEPRGHRATAASQDRYWLGEDGKPLPFRSDEEIKDFLLNAEIVDIEPIGIGVTRPERVTLEMDGVRAHAVFRYFEQLYEKGRLPGRGLVVNFRDSFRFEAGAYELARLLCMDNVPPAVTRRIGDRNGTLQLWLYGAMMESERAQEGRQPPNGLRWTRQWHLMRLFDALIGNTDRHAGNMLIDGDWNLWLIDHTRAFYARAPYENLDGIAFVERAFWNRLRSLTRAELDDALGDHLSTSEIGRILKRREHLVEIIEALIAERGEEAVLYDAAS